MDIWDIPYGYTVFHNMVMYCVGNKGGKGENDGIYPVVQWYIYIYQLDMITNYCVRTCRVCSDDRLR